MIPLIYFFPKIHIVMTLFALSLALMHGKVKQVIKYYGNEIAKISQYNELLVSDKKLS